MASSEIGLTQSGEDPRIRSLLVAYATAWGWTFRDKDLWPLYVEGICDFAREDPDVLTEVGVRLWKTAVEYELHGRTQGALPMVIATWKRMWVERQVYEETQSYWRNMK